MAYPINETVAQIGKISIEGNIIPHPWYLKLRNENGKFQTNAALILAEIVYWYRPISIYDLQGKLIGNGKKFQEDILQLDYKHFEKKFGFTKNQTRDALSFLEKNGLVYREFRNIVVGNGYVLNNVLYIGIYPEKIAEISIKPASKPVLETEPYSSANSFLNTSQHNEPTPESNQQQEPPASQEKDWSIYFCDEEKSFLNSLLEIIPEIGEPIQKRYATWWIKKHGIEKVESALELYFERVQKAKKNSSVPMPRDIGKYISKALKDNLKPHSSSKVSNENKNDVISTQATPIFSEEVIGNFRGGHPENQGTNTETSMTSMLVNEINDKESMTSFKTENKQATPKSEKSITSTQSSPSISTMSEAKKTTFPKFQKSKNIFDGTKEFSEKEKKFLKYLLLLKPEEGELIEEKHATWWIKTFGIEKIEKAILVYRQQVEKARCDCNIPMPRSMPAYIRHALNKGILPCRDHEINNKAFAEDFKKNTGWSDLKITEKYCRAEGTGKEWYYFLPEKLFIESLTNTYETFYCSGEVNHLDVLLLSI